MRLGHNVYVPNASDTLYIGLYSVAAHTHARQLRAQQAGCRPVPCAGARVLLHMRALQDCMQLHAMGLAEAYPRAGSAHVHPAPPCDCHAAAGLYTMQYCSTVQ